MAGALGVIATSTVIASGQHAQPVYVDNTLPIVGPAQAVIVTNGEVPQLGGPAIPVRYAPVGTPALGPALPIYVVSGYLPSAYSAQVLETSPANLLAYWPMDESSGTVAIDRSGNGRNGAYTGVTLGAVGIGDGRTAASFDGTTSYNNVFSTSLQSAFNGSQGTFVIWGRVSGAGVWTDGITRRMILFQVDASNRLGIFKPTTNNELDCLYVAGGVALGAAKTAFSPTTTFSAGLTWNKTGDQMIFYVNGIAITPVSTGLGVFAGSVSATQTIIGALNTGATAQVWSGVQAHAAVWNTALSAAQMLTLATVPQ